MVDSSGSGKQFILNAEIILYNIKELKKYASKDWIL